MEVGGVGGWGVVKGRLPYENEGDADSSFYYISRVEIIVFLVHVRCSRRKGKLI